MLPILLQPQENLQKTHQHTAATEKQHYHVKPTTLSHTRRATRADSHQTARSFSEWRSPG